MLPSLLMRNTRNRRPTGWSIGLAGSVAVHVGLLGGLFLLGRRVVSPEETATLEMSDATAALAAIEVSSDDPARIEPGDPPLTRDLRDLFPLARAWDAREGDRDNPIAMTVGPRQADGRLRRAPAPDQGQNGGQPPDHAFRRDRSTLRARLTDGALEAQPSRLRTSRRPSSPQAIRSEPVVGIGDTPRTRTPSRIPGPTLSQAEHTLALGGEPDGASRLQSTLALPAPPVVAARIAPRPSPEHAAGPLDAEAGPRRFDVERPGQAADDQTLRAASNEGHPGLTDFSRTAALAATTAPTGRGPGSAPGAVDHPATGAAATALGAMDPKAPAVDVNERTLDRRYQRYKLEIRQRVDRVLEFPRALALRLEQGVTIVEFVVDIDGRLGDGPRVVKSSGFEEFDNAAVRAVRRAAPFPPMSDRAFARPLPVSMPVTFDNPVIR